MPLAWIYKQIVSLRNKFFDWHILISLSYPIPIISIGNLTVGGTGKTPHAEYLIELLKDKFPIAVLSRGYKRKSRGFILGNSQTLISQIGDEPYQMLHKYPEISVAVDESRCHGVECLMREKSNLQVILLDDAFQHRYIKPGLSILLVDYHRPIFQDQMLPAGRLREPVQEKQRANIIIVSKCPSQMSSTEQEEWTKNISLEKGQTIFFTTLQYGNIYALFATAIKKELTFLANKHVLLLAGIALPAPLIEELSKYTPHITTILYPDHHCFKSSDIRHINQTFSRLPANERMVITTEKDAVRLLPCTNLSKEIKSCLYVLPIKVKFLNNTQESFNQNIINYVRENPRDSSISKS